MGAEPRRLDGPYVTYTTDSGEDVQVEIEPSDGFFPISKDRSLGSMSFAVRPAMAAGDAIFKEARVIHPSEMTVRFSIKVIASGVMIAKGAGEGNFEITMSWRAEDRGA